jgi:hypothetical protein
MGRCLFIGFLFYANFLNAQNKPSFFAFTQATVRTKTKLELVNLVDATIQVPLVDSNYKKWKSAFWAMEIMLYKPIAFEKNIPLFLNQFNQLNADLQWSFLEALYTLYPGIYAKQMNHVLQESKTDKIKALALEYLYLDKIYPTMALNNSFRQSPYYQLYLKNIRTISSLVTINESTVLNSDFLPNQFIIVSFQYKDRNNPGYLMIRTADNKWVADKKNRPLRFTQLARSITNMPYYLTNGNTPQGLFRITGIDTSNNNWIGPTTNLQMIMPYEQTDGTRFFADSTELANKKIYESLLSPLSSITGLWQSYDAGKIGRSEIIAHGTTIPTEFYAKEQYFPCTPSLGCLCSPEIWNEEGNLISSVQAEWISEIKKLPKQPTYLLVIEL